LGQAATVLVLITVSALPDLVEAVEGQDGPVRSQPERPCLDLDSGQGVLGRSHPAGEEPPPDQVVEAVLVRAQELPHVVRPPGRVGGPNRLVRLLGTRPALLLARLAQVPLTQVAPDPGL